MTINKDKYLNDLSAAVKQMGQYKPKQVPQTSEEYPTATQLKKKWRLERQPPKSKSKKI